VSAVSGAGGFWDVCGVGAADIDGDGFLDLCATAVNGGSTRVYRNNGDGTFSDIANSGVGGESQACVFGDVNNDGLPDLWVGWYWTNSRMFLGTGGLNPPLADITGSSGTGVGQTWEGGAFADVDNDGNLDLYVVRDGGNKLYMGDGAGHFSEQAAARGVQPGVGCRAVAFADVNGDGFPDLFVGTGTTCALYLNDGTGHFTDVTVAAGLAGITAPASAIQVAMFGDINNDGAPDLYVASWGRAWLLLNDGAGHFTDVSVSSGVSPLAGSTSYAAPFGCAFGDYDNDGFLDLFIAGGEIGGGNYPNLLFHNNHDGTFTDVAAAEGVQDVAVNHVGAIFFDMDNDGDLDLFVGHHPNLTYRNETNNSAYFKVRVTGSLSNRSGIGSKVWVYAAGHLGDPLFLQGYREVSAGSGQASCPPAEQHFGLPATGTYDVRVRFPSGTVVDLPGQAAGQILNVLEPVLPAVIRVDSSASNGAYGVGALIPVDVTFSAPVAVTGTPTLTLATGAATTAVSYTSGSGGKTLTFLYTVASGDSSPRLDYVSSSALSLSGGTIKQAGGTTDAALTLPAPGAAGSLGATRNLVIDGTIPGVTGVSSVQPSGTYHPGQSLTLTVTFSENVNVAGVPQLTLATAPSPSAAAYVSGTGSSTLSFSYLVIAGQSANPLDYVSSTALSLNGGAITNAVGTAAVLTLATAGAPGSLAANRALVIDGVGPTVTSVSSPDPNGTYWPGSLLTITVAFSETVIVTGTPKLTLATGSSPTAVPYLSGSGTNILAFHYPVAEGDHSDALDYVSSGSLALNGGTIRDVAANDATLGLPTPQSIGSLSFSKSLRIVTPKNLTVSGCGCIGLDGLLILTPLLAWQARRRRMRTCT
jgi:hypothetical protein